MTDARPHVVMVVGNDVVRDSRVKKSALTAAATGARVTVLGLSPLGYATRTSLGPVTLLRVPMEDTYRVAFRDGFRPSDTRAARPLSKAEFVLRRRQLKARIAQTKQEYTRDVVALKRSATARRERDTLATASRVERAKARRRQAAEDDRRRRDERADEVAQRSTRAKDRYRDARATGELGVLRDRGARTRMNVSVRTVRTGLLMRRQLRRVKGHLWSLGLRVVLYIVRGWLRLSRRTRSAGLRLQLAPLRLRHRLRLWRAKRELERLDRAYHRPQSTERSSGPVQDWRDELATLHDMDEAYAPVLDELAPDVLHAHDAHVLGTAARAKARAAAAGREMLLVYDAHEYVAGMALADERRLQAYTLLEREYIGDADAVVTVSDPLADLLQQEHALAERPTVVLNAPIAQAPTDGPQLRAVVGLAEGTPLLVYSGGITPVRGVDTLVEAVARLEGVHLALVSPMTDYARTLLDRAEELGIGDRVHVAPMVGPAEVPAYLSSASVGVHPLRSGYVNHEIALPNKLFEYAHAGLPVVVSDTRAMSDFVREHGIGEVFASGDPDDLAGAARNVLADEAAYRAALRGDLLARFSWESQAHRLYDLYLRLVPDLHRPAHDVAFAELLDDVGPVRRAVASLLLGPENRRGLLTDVATAWRTHGDSGVDVMGLVGTEGGGNADIRVGRVRLGDVAWQTQHAATVLRSRSVVVAEDGRSIFGGLNGGRLVDDAPMLRSHHVQGVLLVTRLDLVDVEELCEARARGLLVASLDPTVTRDHPDIPWVPLPVLPSATEADTDGEGLVVAVTGDNDPSVPPACEELARRGVIRLTGAPEKADLVVTGVRSDPAYDADLVRWLRTGAAVASHVPGELDGVIDASLPVHHVAPDELTAALEDLTTRASDVRAGRRERVAFVRRVHDPARTVAALRALLGSNV